MTLAEPELRLDRLRNFIAAMGSLVDLASDEARILAEGSALLSDLVSHDDWLPPAYAAPNPDRYQQYLLHCDSQSRFSVVSFVWAPGQATPIHDHTIWGLVGMLRGAEIAQSYERREGSLVMRGEPLHLRPGDVERLSPASGDIHSVRNALSDQASISIHVYGADIGAVHRSIFSPDGTVKPFVSGYSNQHLPNIWGSAYR